MMTKKELRKLEKDKKFENWVKDRYCQTIAVLMDNFHKEGYETIQDVIEKVFIEGFKIGYNYE